MVKSTVVAEPEARASSDAKLHLFDTSNAKARLVKSVDLKTKAEWNPRISLPDVPALAENIRAFGVQKPLEVVEHKGVLLVIRGHRRLAAISEIIRTKDDVLPDGSGKTKGLGNLNPDKIPVIDYGKIDDEATVMMAYVDHHTVPLQNQMEQARACNNLRNAGMKQDEIAETLGLSRTQVQYLLGIMRLPPVVRASYTEFLKKREELGMKAVLKNAEIPVWEQRNLQRAVTLNNLKHEIGKRANVTDDIVKGYLEAEDKDKKHKIPAFDRFMADFDKDKGRAMSATSNSKKTRSDKDVKDMRVRIENESEPAVKDALLALCDWFLNKSGAEIRVSGYFKSS